MSPAYRSRPIKRVRRTQAEIASLRDQLFDIVEANKPATVRQVFYLAVTQLELPKTEATYKNVICRLLGIMRREEQLPYGWIADNKRILCCDRNSVSSGVKNGSSTAVSSQLNPSLSSR
jgi:hypothetical protein